MASDWHALATAVSLARGDLDLSQKQFAERSGIGVDTISMIELAKRTRITSKVRTALEAAFNWPRGTVDQILRTGKIPERQRTARTWGHARDRISSMKPTEVDEISDLLHEATGNMAVVKAWVLGVQRIKDEVIMTTRGASGDAV